MIENSSQSTYPIGASTLTAKEVAADLQLSEYTVLEYLRRGVIPAFQAVPGSPWRINADEYEDWKRQPRTPTDPNRIEPRSARSRAAMGRSA